MSVGGADPVWSQTGRELFYQGKPEPRIMVTRYSVAGDSFSPERPHAWNEKRVDGFDLMPDGKRAVIIPAAEQKDLTHATFLLNFVDSLKSHR